MHGGVGPSNDSAPFGMTWHDALAHCAMVLIMADDRKNFSIRLSDAGNKSIDRVAVAAAINWSEAARRMLAYADAYMPEGWHPGKLLDKPPT